MFIMLLLSYFKQTVSKEPKNADYILVKDYRDHSNPTKRTHYPTVHILNREFRELLLTGSQKPFQFKDDDGFGKDNEYKKVMNKNAMKSNEDLTEIINAEEENTALQSAVSHFRMINESTDEHLTGEDLITRIKKEKIELLKKKQQTVFDELVTKPMDETDQEGLEASNMIRFYKVKGSDLDSEIREI